MPFDVHLMIAPADPYLAAFAEAGADIISLHPEAGPHLHRSLQTIRALGKKAGVVLNPATPVDAVAHVLDLTDLILVMSVNPGFGGQSFLDSQLAKIATLRRMIDATGTRHPPAGGWRRDAATAPRCIAAGADVLVAGTAVFGQADYARRDRRAARPAPGRGMINILRGARQKLARLQARCGCPMRRRAPSATCGPATPRAARGCCAANTRRRAPPGRCASAWRAAEGWDAPSAVP